MPTLTADYPGLGDDRAYDCIVNVVLGWCARLDDPALMPYPGAVLKMARKKASTVLQSQGKRTAREETWRDTPRSVDDAGDDILRWEYWQAYQGILPLLPDEECRTILRPFLEGARDTDAYAAALGLTHLPLDEQRVRVERAKGRLRKVLSRNRSIRALAKPLREC